MLQTGDSLLRRRLSAATKDEFAWLSDLYAEGVTDYVAIISRFAADSVIGEMDGVYSSWATKAPGGFSDGQVATPASACSAEGFCAALPTESTLSSGSAICAASRALPTLHRNRQSHY